LFAHPHPTADLSINHCPYAIFYFIYGSSQFSSFCFFQFFLCQMGMVSWVINDDGGAGEWDGLGASHMDWDYKRCLANRY